MADIKPNMLSQMSLSPDEQSSFCYFITSQKNLLSFLSSGMITPSDSQFRYQKDSRELASGAIPFWFGGVPSDEICGEALTERRSVVLEYTWEDVAKYERSTSIYSDEYVVILNGPIPIGKVSRIYMPSREIIDDFQLRVTDDIVYDPALFGPFPAFKVLDVTTDFSEIRPPAVSPAIQMIERFAGGISGIRNFAGAIDCDLSHLVPVIRISLATFESARIKLIDGEFQIPDSDELLLSSLFPLLIEHQEEDGYNPWTFLTDLQYNVQVRTDDIPEDLKKWFAYVAALINAEKEVRPLNDDGNVIQRAVLLFILRPKMERLLNAHNSSVSPGPKVLLIAAFMSGCATGATRMSGYLKGDFRTHAKLVDSVIDALWGKSILNISLVKYKEANKGAGTALEINREALFGAEARQDPVLARVLNQAKSLGYNLDYYYGDDNDQDELVYRDMSDRGFRQEVYIERLKASSFGGLNAIRFVSPCVSLSSSKLKRMRKDQLLDLLFRNDGDGMYCAFSLSEKRKALVVEATQIVSTMDDDEFATLLGHVKKVAGEYDQV